MSTPPGLIGPDAPAPLLAPGQPPLSRRPALIRPRDNRMLAGVAAGVAHHLCLPVRAVRFGFVIATLLGGPGAVLYAWLWALVPDESSAAAEAAEQVFRQSNRAPYSGGPILGAQIGGRPFPAPPIPPRGGGAAGGLVTPGVVGFSGGVGVASGDGAPTGAASTTQAPAPTSPGGGATSAGAATSARVPASDGLVTPTGATALVGPPTSVAPVTPTGPAAWAEKATVVEPAASTDQAGSAGSAAGTGVGGPGGPVAATGVAAPGEPTAVTGPTVSAGPVASTGVTTTTGTDALSGVTLPSGVAASSVAGASSETTVPREATASVGTNASTEARASTGATASTAATTSTAASALTGLAGLTASTGTTSVAHPASSITAAASAPTLTQPAPYPTAPSVAQQASSINPTAPEATETLAPGDLPLPQTAAEAAQAARAAAVAAAAVQVEQEERSTRRTRLRADLFAGLCLTAAAVVLVASWAGLEVQSGWVLPMLIVASGAVIAYAQFDEADRSRWFSPTGFTTRAATLRLLLGIVLVVLGIVLLVLQNTDPLLLGQTVLATFAVLVGVAVVFAPWGVRFWRALDTERTGRVREAERADIAAHLHDSVLQTLTLIQRRSSDSAEVARLARAQERDLRGWLYGGGDNDPTMISARVAALAADAEDVHGAVIEVVTVGDRPVDERGISLLSALREAVANAARHAGGESIRVYVECMPDGIEAFVRDRGPGFDLTAVPEDRLGVRESIIGRMERHGGSARIRSTEGEGTEIRLLLPDNGSTEEEQ